MECADGQAVVDVAIITFIISPSTRCVSEASAILKETDIYMKPCIILNDIL
jgi:hypothetical protein